LELLSEDDLLEQHGEDHRRSAKSVVSRSDVCHIPRRRNQEPGFELRLLTQDGKLEAASPAWIAGRSSGLMHINSDQGVVIFYGIEVNVEVGNMIGIDTKSAEICARR